MSRDGDRANNKLINPTDTSGTPTWCQHDSGGWNGDSQQAQDTPPSQGVHTPPSNTEKTLGGRSEDAVDGDKKHKSLKGLCPFNNLLSNFSSY